MTGRPSRAPSLRAKVDFPAPPEPMTNTRLIFDEHPRAKEARPARFSTPGVET
jgi:hypothetical protein